MTRHETIIRPLMQDILRVYGPPPTCPQTAEVLAWLQSTLGAAPVADAHPSALPALAGGLGGTVNPGLPHPVPRRPVYRLHCGAARRCLGAGNRGRPLAHLLGASQGAGAVLAAPLSLWRVWLAPCPAVQPSSIGDRPPRTRRVPGRAGASVGGR